MESASNRQRMQQVMCSIWLIQHKTVCYLNEYFVYLIVASEFVDEMFKPTRRITFIK